MTHKKSIKTRIITPLFLFIILIMASLAVIAYRTSIKVFWLDLTHQVQEDETHIKNIIDLAINELTSSQLLNTRVVVEAKKKAVIDEIKTYWANNDLKGYIKTSGGIIYSSLDSKYIEALETFLPDKGHFNFEKSLYYIVGSVINIPIWDMKVVFVEKPLIPFIHLLSKDVIIAILTPTIILSFLLILAITFIILRDNLQKPIKAITKDIQEKEAIRETGITELDIIGHEFNKAMKQITNKTLQYETLHNIAISIHETSSIDKIFDVIIDNARTVIGAPLAAVVFYTEEGRFKKLTSRGTSISPKRLPEGKGILELMRLSLTPLRINNVKTHPAFSGTFPEGHPVIENFLGYPIYSSEGRPIAALYLSNKEGGFTEEDELMLKAICADAAVAIERTENISRLERFRAVIESAFDMIVITDEEGHILYANPAFESLTGYPLKEAINKKTSILRSGYHDTEFYQTLWDTIKAGKVWKGEFINKKKNGDLYHASAVIFPVRTDEGINYVSIQRDITEGKKLYEQLLRAQKMEAIGTLAGGIAHDFNNLLTAVLGYAELLLEEIKEGNELYKHVNIIYNAALRGSELASKILTVTRKEKMDAKVININDIIRDSLDILRKSIPFNIEIIANLKEDMPMIKADPGQMQQVIMNLAINARDAMPEGGKLIIETDTVGMENGAANGLPFDKMGFLKLSVSDTGTGIDTETQRRIFDPFFTTKETGKGTGLGLYIVHSIITNHGGYINLYSEVGKGTRFNIYLPIVGTQREEKDGQRVENLRRTETILVIDDESDIRGLCKDMLEPLGYNVLSAQDGNEGIRIFRDNAKKISLVILDMVMPKMMGNEVFHNLKAIKPDVKVILSSGYSYNGFAGINTLLKEGANGFIQKPFTRQTLEQAIIKALSE